MPKNSDDTRREDGIRVLRQTKPDVCGGTDATLDERAPKEILSEEMILFDVTSALNVSARPRRPGDEPLGYVSAFAAPVAGQGVFLFLATSSGFSRCEERRADWALVTADVFPALVRLTRERGLAENNGFHSVTHGLPENFGGSILVRYADGEKISVSDNQSPVLDNKTGARIAELFTDLMKGERVVLPAISELKEIRYAEERENGGFSRATLTLLPDGTGVNEKSSRYDDPRVYESRKEVDAATVAAIKASMERNGILAWAGLPANGFSFGGKKKLTFVFSDGRTVAVRDDRLLPDPICRGFFDIELKIAP
ncbi:MAG: hypothetical protein KIG36_02765 [Eubacteriales bacterium]|nr:hypothetical protein [Eubacteriales bacterium]